MVQKERFEKQMLPMVLVLGLLSIFPPLATDMYLSALGQLAETLQTSHFGAELSLSLFFLGLCIGQLCMGVMSDVFGRKPIILIGAAVFIVTSIALTYVNNIFAFNFLRVVQAIGASSGMVISRAIVNDLYRGQHAAKLMTILVMLLTLGPIISPTLGSIILEAWGWKSIFWAMSLIGMIALFLASKILVESLPIESRHKDPIKLASVSASKLITNRYFIVWTLIAGFSQGGLFAFITGSSAIFQNGYGLSSLEYALIFALVAAALIIFGLVNNLLLRKYFSEQILEWSLPVFLLCAILATISSTVEHLGFFIFFLWLAMGFVGLVSSNAMSLAMDQTMNTGGVGSAIIGAIQFAIAFLVSSVVAFIPSASALPMTIGISLSALLAALIYFVSKERLWAQNAS